MMKQADVVRQPASPDADTSGAKGPASRAQKREPALPHERDEGSDSQASAAPQQHEVGRQAYENATDGTTDTDKGPEMDKLYNDKVAPDRDAARPRK